MTKGYTPLKAAEFSSQKRAIEYVYQSDIPLKASEIVKVGEVDYSTQELAKGLEKSFLDVFAHSLSL